MNNDELIAKANQLEKDHLWNEALEIYHTMEDENDVQILEKLAWCSSRAEIYEDAIKYYSSLHDISPDNAKYCYSIGYQFYMMQKWNVAIEWFRKTLAIYPEYFVVKYRLAYSLRQTCGNHLVLRNQNYWDALKLYDECDALWEKYNAEQKNKYISVYSDICFQKGKLLYERNKFDKASASFLKAIEMKPDFDDCKYQLSKVYLKMNNHEAALNVLPSTSKKYYVYEQRIDVYIALERLDDAIIELQNLLKFRNKDYLHRKMAEIYLKKKQIEKALKESALSVDIGKSNHINRYLFAKILFECELYKKALDEVNAAIKLKLDKYSSEYKDALILKNSIIKKIDELNYQFDDKEKLAFYFSNEENTILQGYIDKYNTQKGYGFIKANGLKYYFHISNVIKKDQLLITEKLKVSFNPYVSEKGMNAKEIKLI